MQNIFIRSSLGIPSLSHLFSFDLCYNSFICAGSHTLVFAKCWQQPKERTKKWIVDKWSKVGANSNTP